MNLDNLTELYKSKDLGGVDELMHLQGWKKVKNWFLKSDIEKQECRKLYLKKLKAYFQEDDEADYVEQSIVVTSCILDFLNKIDYSSFNFEGYTEEDKSFFRIYNMLWCEKEYILYMESPHATKIHVSMDVFRPLIEKVNHTKRYSNYKLDSLFKEYQTMLSLFDELRSKA